MMLNLIDFNQNGSSKRRILLPFLILGFQSQWACKNDSPPKPNTTPTVEQSTAWTDALKIDQVTDCTTKISIPDTLKATKKCQCLINQAAAEWTYSEYTSDLSNKLDQLLAEESVRTCLNKADEEATTGGGTQATHAWGRAALIETDNVGDAYSPKVIFNTNGEAMAIWVQADAANQWQVWSKWYEKQIWHANKKVAEIPASETARNPRIAFDAQGNVHAFWNTTTSEANGDGKAVARIWWSHFTKANGWETPVVLSTTTDRVNIYPAVAFNSKGAGVVAWYSGIWVKVGWLTDYTVLARTYDPAANKWSEAIQIENPTLPLAPAQAIEASYSDSDDAFVTWVRGVSSTNSQVALNHFKTGGAWDAAPTLLSNSTTGFNQNINIDTDAKGNTAIIWVNTSTTSKFNVAMGNAWKNGAVIGPSQLSTNTDGRAFFTDIAFDREGHAIGVWSIRDSTIDNPLQAITYDTATGWGTPQKLTDGAVTHLPSWSTISGDGTGRAIVSWVEYDGIRDNAKAVLWENAKWGETFLLETDDAASALSPSISLSPQGGAIAVWLQYDNNQRINVWANFFE